MAPTGVSIILPVFRAEAGALRDAYSSVRNQTFRELEILTVINGADAGLTRLAYALAADEPRGRVIELAKPSLAAALNTGLRAAKFDLVARMDADDTCRPARIERQAAFMREHPGVTVLGTAWDVVNHEGGLVRIERPWPDPARARWKLLLGNYLCHGSVMMRRDRVLQAGGYDEGLVYAQDYELWLRLAGAGLSIANLPDLLYRYSEPGGRKHREQARAASAAMANAWARVPAANPEVAQSIAALLADATWGGAAARAAFADLERLLDRHGPCREGLMAWQWIERRAHGRDVERRERLRPGAQRLAAIGVASAWLYGAGRHTAWLVENLDELGIAVEGVLDDAAAGQERYGFTVRSPGEVPAGSHVVLSSDAHEQALWDASLPLRARGVHVHRLYGVDPGVPVASL